MFPSVETLKAAAALPDIRFFSLFLFPSRVISNSIQLLVQDLDAACDPALTAMSKVGSLKLGGMGRKGSQLDCHRCFLMTFLSSPSSILEARAASSGEGVFSPSAPDSCDGLPLDMEAPFLLSWLVAPDGASSMNL